MSAERLHRQLHAASFEVERAWAELIAGEADVPDAPLPAEVLARLAHELHDLWTARLDPESGESELIAASAVDAARVAADAAAAPARTRVHLRGTQDPRLRLRALLQHALGHGLWTRSERLMLQVVLAYDLDEHSSPREVAARARELERIAGKALGGAPNLSAWATLLAARLWWRARKVEETAEDRLCRCVGEVLAADAPTRVGGAAFSLAGLLAGIGDHELAARLLEVVRQHRGAVELASVRLGPDRLEDRLGAVAMLALLDEREEAAALRAFELVALAGLRLGALGCTLDRPGARRTARQQWALRHLARIAAPGRTKLRSPAAGASALLRDDPRAIVELVMRVVARCPGVETVADRLRAQHVPGWQHGDGWRAVVRFDVAGAEAALAVAAPGEARAAALTVLAALRELDCRAGEGRACLEQALAELEPLPGAPSPGRTALAWQARHGLGLLERDQQRLEAAIGHFEHAAVIAASAGLLSRAAASQSLVATILRDQGLEQEADRRLGAARLTAALAVSCGQADAAPILADLRPTTRLLPDALARVHRTRFQPRKAPLPNGDAVAAELEALRWLAVLADSRNAGAGAACLTEVRAQLGRMEQEGASAAARRISEALRHFYRSAPVVPLAAPAPELRSGPIAMLDELDRARRRGRPPPRIELEILVSAATQLLREGQGQDEDREALARAHAAIVSLEPATGWADTGRESAVREVLASCELRIRPERVAALRAEQLRWRLGVLRGMQTSALGMQHRKKLERSLASSLRDLADSDDAREAAELVALVKRGDLGVEELAGDGERVGGYAREEEVLQAGAEGGRDPGPVASSATVGRTVCLDYFLAPNDPKGPEWEALVIVHVAEPGAVALRPVRVLTLRSGRGAASSRVALLDCGELAKALTQGPESLRDLETHVRRLGALLFPPALLETLRELQPGLVLLAGHGRLFHVPVHALPLGGHDECLVDLYPVAYVARPGDGLAVESDPARPASEAAEGWPVLLGELDGAVEEAWATATKPGGARLRRLDDADLKGSTEAIERLAAARHAAFLGHGVHEAGKLRSWRSRLRLTRGGRATVRAIEQVGPVVRGAELLIMACNAASRAGGAQIGVLDALVRMHAGVVVAPLAPVGVRQAGNFLSDYVGARQRGVASTLAYREALTRLRGAEPALAGAEAWRHWVQWSPFVLYRGG